MCWSGHETLLTDCVAMQLLICCCVVGDCTENLSQMNEQYRQLREEMDNYLNDLSNMWRTGLQLPSTNGESAVYVAGGIIVRILDLWPRGRGFDSRSGRYQVVSFLESWTGDCLRAGELSQYITSHTGQLSLPSLWGRYIKYRLLWLGLRCGTFTCVGWQVTVCDPIWQLTLWALSSEMG